MDPKHGVTLRVPGDKSISQRALILGALAEGDSRVEALLRSADPVATGRALQRVGITISGLDIPDAEVVVRGNGFRGWRQPEGPLDLQNSGTGVRLLAGALASQPLVATLKGDVSLSGRPMARIATPLGQMGARISYLEREGRLPMRIEGGELSSIVYKSPVASAQVKSAVLLAAVGGSVVAEVREPRQSRDHTERMLAAMGVSVSSGAVEAASADDEARWTLTGQAEDGADGWAVRIAEPPERLQPLDVEVPSDFSSAAFFFALAAASGRGRAVTVRSLGLNRTRTGFLSVLGRMGAAVQISSRRVRGGEPLGDVTVTGGGGLRAVAVGEAELPAMIDEVPVLIALAARAEGTTRITGAAELRVKESDRIAALATNLRGLGVEVEELPDGLEVAGSTAPLSGQVRCFGDHRIAMAFGILGALPGSDIRMDDPALAGVSFPGFWELLAHTRERLCK